MSLFRRDNISVFDSFVRRGLTPHVAWRVSFVTVPFVILAAVGLAILFFSPDTPVGPWKDRHINRLIEGIETQTSEGKVVDIPGYDVEDAKKYVSSLIRKLNSGNLR